MPLPPAGMRVDEWSVRVSRAEVEAVNIIPTILELGPLLAPENVRRFQRKVFLYIDGYDDDPRDLWEVEEVRRWAQVLDVAFPFWFYFLQLGPRSSLQWIAFTLCPYRKVPEGKMIDPNDMDRFVKWHLFALANLCAIHHVAPEEMDRLAKGVHDFFGTQP
jgi:hypothetical protein